MMRKNLPLLLLLLICFSGFGLKAQSLSLQAHSGLVFQNDVWDPHNALDQAKSRTVSCGPDTLFYPFAKQNGLPALLINSNSARSLAQYYDAPQAITVHGFSFYAYKPNTLGGSSLNLICELYAAGADSLPTGSALASATIQVDTGTGGGFLSDLQIDVSFTNPVTITGTGYVLTVDNGDPASIAMITNDWDTAGTGPDGNMEWLMAARIAATWYHGYQVNVSGIPLDCDVLIQPHVTYDLDAVIGISQPCFNSVTDTVCFTNTSSPVIFHRMYNQLVFAGQAGLASTWDFGNGSGSQPVIDTCINYNSCGPYNVSLADTIIGWTISCVEDTMISMDTCGSNAAISWTIAGLQVSFSDLANSGGTWDFGDGNTSTQQNPIHTYANQGNYVVCYSLVNACLGNKTICDTLNLICIPPTSAFGFMTNILTASFSDSSSGTLSWAWDFGDGNSDTTQNPVHSYAGNGNYNACLITINACGIDTFCQTVNVICPAPVSTFSFTSNNLTAAFSNTSQTSGPAGYVWDFGDGASSNLANPVHTYANASNYTVCLSVSDQCGADSICQPVSITCTPPVSAFNYAATNLSVAFTNNSIATSNFIHLWNFGDGSNSSLFSPSHTYSVDGAYQVCLEVIDSCASNLYCDTVNVIFIGRPEWEIEGEISLFPNPGTGTFFLDFQLLKTKSVQSELIDLRGRVLKTYDFGEVQSSRKALDLTGIAPGTYWLKLRAGSKLAVRKVVIME